MRRMISSTVVAERRSAEEYSASIISARGEVTSEKKSVTSNSARFPLSRGACSESSWLRSAAFRKRSRITDAPSTVSQDGPRSRENGLVLMSEEVSVQKPLHMHHDPAFWQRAEIRK